jgi:hypothetical protein
MKILLQRGTAIERNKGSTRNGVAKVFRTNYLEFTLYCNSTNIIALLEGGEKMCSNSRSSTNHVS